MELVPVSQTAPDRDWHVPVGVAAPRLTASRQHRVSVVLIGVGGSGVRGAATSAGDQPHPLPRPPGHRAPPTPVTLFSVHEILISNKYAILPPDPSTLWRLWWAECCWHWDMNRCYSCRNPHSHPSLLPPKAHTHALPLPLRSSVPWISFILSSLLFPFYLFVFFKFLLTVTYEHSYPLLFFT